MSDYSFLEWLGLGVLPIIPVLFASAVVFYIQVRRVFLLREKEIHAVWFCSAVCMNTMAVAVYLLFK